MDDVTSSKDSATTLQDLINLLQGKSNSQNDQNGQNGGPKVSVPSGMGITSIGGSGGSRSGNSSRLADGGWAMGSNADAGQGAIMLKSGNEMYPSGGAPVVTGSNGQMGAPNSISQDQVNQLDTQKMKSQWEELIPALAAYVQHQQQSGVSAGAAPPSASVNTLSSSVPNAASTNPQVSYTPAPVVPPATVPQQNVPAVRDYSPTSVTNDQLSAATTTPAATTSTQSSLQTGGTNAPTSQSLTNTAALTPTTQAQTNTPSISSGSYGPPSGGGTGSSSSSLSNIGSGGAGSMDSLGTLGDEGLINSMGSGGGGGLSSSQIGSVTGAIQGIGSGIGKMFATTPVQAPNSQFPSAVNFQPVKMT